MNMDAKLSKDDLIEALIFSKAGDQKIFGRYLASPYCEKVADFLKEEQKKSSCPADIIYAVPTIAAMHLGRCIGHAVKQGHEEQLAKQIAGIFEQRLVALFKIQAEALLRAKS